MTIYPHEGWHWRMATASLFLAVLGVVSVASALSPSARAEPGMVAGYLAGGLALVGAVIYAAWVSQFWNRVRSLAQPHKSAVWLLAVAGFVLAGVFIVAFVVFWNWLRGFGD